jgi:hypothetical protein
MSRIAFSRADQLGLDQRWAILMRSPRCCFCGVRASQSELWVFRRTSTGLPVPSHCDSACETCAVKHHLEVMLPAWADKEVGRGKP